MTLKEGGLRGSLRNVGVGAIPDSVMWQSDVDWNSAVRDSNVIISADSFTLNDEQTSGYLTTDGKPNGLGLDFELYDSFEDSRWEEPRIGGHGMYRPIWQGRNVFTDTFGEPDITPTNDGIEMAATEQPSMGLSTPYNGPVSGVKWEFRFRNTVSFSPAPDYGFDWYLVEDNWDNLIRFNNDSDEDDRIGIVIKDSGVSNGYYIDGGISDDSWHTVEIERDGSGNWQWSLDSVLQDTFTDTTIPTFSRTAFIVDAEHPPVEFDYFEVTAI